MAGVRGEAEATDGAGNATLALAEVLVAVSRPSDVGRHAFEALIDSAPEMQRLCHASSGRREEVRVRSDTNRIRIRMVVSVVAGGVPRAPLHRSRARPRPREAGRVREDR